MPFVGQAAFGERRDAYVARAHLATVADPASKEPFAAIAKEAAAHGQCYCNASAIQGTFVLSDTAFDRINVPTLLVWGEGDPTHARTDKAKLPADLTRVTRRVVAAAGHQPELEEPGAFEAHLTGWLAAEGLIAAR